MMGISKMGLCVECDDGVVKLLTKPSKKLCAYHNNKRLTEGKPPRAAPKPHRRKKTGEWALFLALWAIRPHACTNCLTPLGSDPLPIYFSHIKSKGAHPELRLEPKNIQILCGECHRIFDHGTREQFEKRKKTITA